MRDDLDRLVGRETPDHAGLAYEVWAPEQPGTGKENAERRDAWLQALEKIAVPVGYKEAYEVWSGSFIDDEAARAEVVELASRLLVGHGNPSPTEVGLTLHHTWGVPVIPGSALKGLLNHYVDAVYGPGPEAVAGHPMERDLPDEVRARARYQGVTWNHTRIVHGPGEIHRAIFGAPAAPNDSEFAQHGAGETRGGVVFHDALMVPRTGEAMLPLAADVLTVHQQLYYRSGGGDGPSDHDSPIPVAFLTVRPGTRFLLAVSGPSAWTGLALALLRDALREWGVGGKTAAGYGRITDYQEVVADPAMVHGRRAARAEKAAADALAARRQAILGASTVLPEFRAWMAATRTEPQPPQRVTLNAIEAQWMDRLCSLTPEERSEAAREIQRMIKSPKVEEARDELLARLRQG